MANIKPLGDKVLVQPNTSTEKTAGGIVLPDSAKERPQEGKVVAVGPGRTLDNGDQSRNQRQRRRHRHLLEVWRHRNQAGRHRVSDSR